MDPLRGIGTLGFGAKVDKIKNAAKQKLRLLLPRRALILFPFVIYIKYFTSTKGGFSHESPCECEADL